MVGSGQRDRHGPERLRDHQHLAVVAVDGRVQLIAHPGDLIRNGPTVAWRHIPPQLAFVPTARNAVWVAAKSKRTVGGVLPSRTDDAAADRRAVHGVVAYRLMATPAPTRVTKVNGFGRFVSLRVRMGSTWTRWIRC